LNTIITKAAWVRCPINSDVPTWCRNVAMLYEVLWMIAWCQVGCWNAYRGEITSIRVPKTLVRTAPTKWWPSASGVWHEFHYTDVTPPHV
jgi:hypothetical protein